MDVDSNDIFHNGGTNMMYTAGRPVGPSKEALEAAKRYHNKQLELEKVDRERRAENFRLYGKFGKFY